MKGIALLAALAVTGAVALAGPTEKPPAWLVGKFTGYDNYMHANYSLDVYANGNVIVDETNKKDHLFHAFGRFHGEVLDIGKKVYRYTKTADGVTLRNIWREKDQVTLKKVS